ncbi:endonuclease/exonuclease/phosphatase family protein [Phenylobacterium sp. LH3H17]|uniref:endonuclease/exonuclease/phosphatase family protein n=1 Tax=Phenylobacterium sp. LH3H17 TaxID=2903901 RepID=UPI0020CA079A|nr:endonuclease/exonuclease/phosphatase family protein [Phenylobacterium sp. LH3H17]UTP37977.1 endonuclease/exonuclease/phosphatase family protein [Phenylobacterium sp. LH3H17]
MGFLRIVATSLGALCALAAVLAQGGRWSGVLDALTHLAPLYLAGGVLVLALALFTPQRLGGTRLAILGGIAVLGALVLVLPELTSPVSPTAPPDAPGRLKLIQFNAEPDPAHYATQVRWLVDQDPDVLVLEGSEPRLRAAILQRMPRHLTCSPNCDVAIYSRARPAAIDRFGGGRYGLGPQIAVVHFSPSDGGHTIVGLHYARPGSVAKSSKTATAVVQSENSRRMLKAVQPLPKARLIVAGDFNSAPWSFVRRREDAALGIERRTRALFSWPAQGPTPPFLPIDHVYAGPAWKTVSVRRGPRIGSDHYPVVAVLAQAP